MKKYDIAQLRKMPLDQLADDEFIVAVWKEDGIRVLEAIDCQNAEPMTMSSFIGDCHTYGGDWGALLLSGVEALYPEVYEAIPEDMGHFAWRCICTVVELLNIKPEVIKL